VGVSFDATIPWGHRVGYRRASAGADGESEIDIIRTSPPGREGRAHRGGRPGASFRSGDKGAGTKGHPPGALDVGTIIRSSSKYRIARDGHSFPLAAEENNGVI